MRQSALVLLTVALSFAGLGAGCPGPSGPQIGRLPALTTDDPEAEAELRRAQALEEKGDNDEAAAAYRAFVETRANDPLLPIAQLALGRLLLEAGKPAEALERLQAVTSHADATIAEQGRFYAAVAHQRLGQQEAAANTLTPMVGRTIAPDDTALLLLTLADARMALGDHVGAATALDLLLSESVPEAARTRGRNALEDLVTHKASPEEIMRMVRELPEDGAGWPMAMRRAVRDADAAGDVARARQLLEAMRDAELHIDEELAAIAMRAERPSDAAPNVVGAVLSLSGRARKVGELALRGVMLAAGLPPKAPLTADSPQVMFRDDGGDPQRAVEAVNELVSVHRVIAIIGPMDGRAAEAAAARAQELGVPIVLLSPTGNPTSHGAMVHRLFPTPAGEIRALLAHAQRTGRRRAAALLPEGPYGDLMLETLTREAAKQGIELAGNRRYPTGATSFGKPIAELLELRFDTLLIADSARQTALIAPALAAAGLWTAAHEQHPATKGARQVLLVAPAVSFDHSLAASVGRYLQGAVFSAPFDAQLATGTGAAFRERFEAQFQQTPDAFAAFAHDAYALIRAAVDGGARTREDVASVLSATRIAAPAGPSAGLLADREARTPTRLLTLDGTAFVPVARLRE